MSNNVEMMRGDKVSSNQRISALHAVLVLFSNFDESSVENLFEGKRSLLGFEIMWLKKQLHEKICNLVGINPDECEIVLMHADRLTECHMHKNGSSTFMVLGEKNRFKNPQGGILTAKFQENKFIYNLKPQKAFAGQIIEIPAKQIHSFYGKDGRMSAIGLVHPKINTDEDKFDIVKYEFTGRENEVVLLN